MLRYDKRTKIYAEDLSETGYTLAEETVEDAVRAVELLRKQPEVDPNRVYVLGQSLGGYASPRIAAKNCKLAGQILLERCLPQPLLAWDITFKSRIIARKPATLRH